MLVVGELINTSRQAIRRAVEARDAGYIRQVAEAQEEGGAHYLDINCGTMVNEEVSSMQWLVNTVQEVSDLPLCIDSPSAQALEAGLALVKAPEPLINSISAEEKRFCSVLPLVKKYRASSPMFTSCAAFPTSPSVCPTGASSTASLWSKPWPAVWMATYWMPPTGQ